MKKNAFLITLLITFFFSSCSNNEDSISEEPEELIADCKVIGTNGTNDTVDYYTFLEIINDSETVTDAETSTETLEDIVYLVQYEYDSENKLTARVRYEQTYYIDTDFKDTDNISYDTSNRISEISTFNRVYQYTALKIFKYNGSETLPSKLTRYKVDESDDSPLITYTEDFTYNNQNQLIKVVKNYREGKEQNPVETIYEYNSDGNLTKIEAVASGEFEFDNWTLTETFENYDAQRNPFKGLPFSDVRGISESNNNYFKYDKEFYSFPNSDAILALQNSQDSPLPTEISGWEYEPTDLYYLKLATYQCEE